jgi:hypothetical protein
MLVELVIFALSFGPCTLVDKYASNEPIRLGLKLLAMVGTAAPWPTVRQY